MSRAGFVLVGGASSRMGHDKALLPFRGVTLVEHVAATVVAAAGSVALVGPAAKYSGFGYPVIPDCMPLAGPLAGICAALSVTQSRWNLVLACDMPAISTPFLKQLLEMAEEARADAFLPVGPSGHPEPLCAVYDLHALPVIRLSLEQGIRKILEAFRSLTVRTWQVPDSQYFENCNTPQEWTSFVDREHSPL